MTLPKQLIMTDDVAFIVLKLCLPLLCLFLLLFLPANWVSALHLQLATLTKGSLKMEFFTPQCRVISQTRADKCIFSPTQLPSQSLHFDLTRNFPNNLDAYDDSRNLISL